MYNPAFHTVLIDSRIEDLRRASQKSTQPGPGRVDRDVDRDLRATRPSTWLRRATWSRRS